MKSYTNIPLKERKRNADRVYRHEVRAEIRAKEREAEAEQLEIKRMYEEKYRAFEQENEAKTDKEREAFAKFEEFLKWREESEGDITTILALFNIVDERSEKCSSQ